MQNKNPGVDFFFNKPSKWQDAFIKLRAICLDSGLQEELKWGKPCYTLKGNNVVLMHGFKEYCALLFHKGVLLKDPQGILIQQTTNVQAARQIRFTSVEEIINQEDTLKAYINDAIAVEKSGQQIEMKKTSQYSIPDEFQQALDGDYALREAFSALTPGRQRGYLLYFSSAKQSKTRISRIEKCIPKIFDGLGLDD